ncbi:MAG: DNA-3-methyladenine glycosylase 2 family protein [Nitrososphaerota archaeon]|jgi:DNA-3-methyladenine glycosylase II|nr:DNA-3-methyladenine glycosylase 2 family protein [Nitrososphaerota archaeon]
MTFTETYTLQPQAPLDFALSCQVFSDGTPLVRSYLNGEFSQVLQINGELVLIKVIDSGSTKTPCLTVTLKSNQALTAKTQQATQDALCYIFNLTFDLTAFYYEVQNDPVMHKITQQLCGFKFPTTPTAFEGLVDAIVEQQISIKVARTIEERLAQRFGKKLEINNETYSAFPTAQTIAESSISDIRACGLSQRKAEYIHNAAEHILSGKLDLETMKTNPDPVSVIRMLDELKGIGPWTAELTLLRGMQRWDVLPADDFGIKRVISTYYYGGKSIKTPEAQETAQTWGKWQGLAAFYLILAEAKNILV